MIDFTFTETRSFLQKTLTSHKQLKISSDKEIVTIETLNEFEIMSFRYTVILYYEELQRKVKSLYSDHLKRDPIHEYFKDRDNKNVSYMDVFLFLFGVKIYENITKEHSEILDTIKAFRQMRNQFAHFKDKFKEEVNRVDWFFSRNEFQNYSFIDNTESFLKIIEARICTFSNNKNQPI